MRNDGKPPGWGTLARPTPNGARIIQLVFRPADWESLAELRERYQSASDAAAFRSALRRVALRPPPPERAAALATATTRASVRCGRRFSTWLRPEDCAALDKLSADHNLSSLAHAGRFVLAAARLSGR